MQQRASSNETPRPGDLLTRTEAARQLRVSVRWLDQQLASGAVAHVRLGRKVLIRREALERFVADREVAS